MPEGNLRQERRWDRAHERYVCADGTVVTCVTEKASEEMPRNGLWVRRHETPVLVVNEAHMDRNVTTLI